MRVPAGVAEGVRRSDAVLAGALLVLSVIQVLWVRPIEVLWLADSSWFGLPLTVVSVLPVAWRRVRPVPAAVVGSSLWWVPTDGFLFVGYVCAVLLFFALGRWAESQRSGLLACAWGLASGTFAFVAIDHVENALIHLVLDIDVQRVAELRVPGAETTLGIAGFWLIVLVPYAIGRYIAAQNRAAREHIVSEREVVRREAVAEERARIVRELHDVVGHEVTLMSIQSEAAAQALQLAPERAAEPIAAVRETAHRATRELRAILDLLGDGELGVTPDPRGLTELTDRAARLGIANTLVVTGEPWPDAPRHWLAVNRIVQECLTNAGKHAPGEKVDVAVEWSDDGVLVRVMNETSAQPNLDAGHGLPGMVERARLLGGTLETFDSDGLFEVRAWLPAPEEAR
ncbi:MAG TPA: histidine kinase [Actinomycetales bacterium]|nr:histidine kinase [Actinomycetales bacterium]